MPWLQRRKRGEEQRTPDATDKIAEVRFVAVTQNLLKLGIMAVEAEMSSIDLSTRNIGRLQKRVIDVT